MSYTDYTATGYYPCCGLPKNQGAHAGACRTVNHRKVWRCAGGSGSGFAFRGNHGFTEVFQDDVDAKDAAGVELFRITV